MQYVAKHTSALVKKHEQLGSTMFEFGMAFTLLAKVSGVHESARGRGESVEGIAPRVCCFPRARLFVIRWQQSDSTTDTETEGGCYKEIVVPALVVLSSLLDARAG